MSQRYPCPMIGCDHQFTAEELTGVTSVTCPKCRSTIQLRSRVAEAPPPPVTPGPPIVHHTATRRSRDVMVYSAVIGGFLLLVAFGIVAAVVSSRGKGTITQPKLPGYRNADYLFALDLPTQDWEDHPGMKSRLQVSQFAAMNSEADPRYVALDVVDFKDRTPSPREMDVEARRKLAQFFNRRFDTNPPADAPPLEGPPVAGQPTHRFTFDGRSPEEELTGQVVFFTHDRLGYWLYYLTPPAFQGESEWNAILAGFRLTGRRPRPSTEAKEQRVFTGKEVKGYRLVDETGRWQLDDDPKAHDPEADLVLRAMDPMNPRKPTLAADLIVLNLKKMRGDIVEQVKAHLLAKQQREGNPNSQIQEIEGKRKDNVGNEQGILVHWRIDNGGVRDRLAVVSIVPRGETLLVLYGDCAWDRRFTWIESFEQLIASLQLEP